LLFTSKKEFNVMTALSDPKV